MREQWFGMCLPVLMLVLMEVILMSQNGEGTNSTRSGNLSTENRRPWRFNEDAGNLQSNNSRSSLDSEILLNSDFSQDYDSPADREVVNRAKYNSLKLPSTRSAVTFVIDSMLSVFCQLARQLIHLLEPYTSVSQLMLRIILRLINLVSPYVMQKYPGSAPESNNSIQNLVSYFNPFAQSTDPKKPSKPDREESGLIMSAVDYFNPFKQTPEPETPPESLNGKIGYLDSLIDGFKPFRSIVNWREIPELADNRLIRLGGIGNSRAQTNSSQFSDPYTNSNDQRLKREAKGCPNISMNYHKAGDSQRAYKLHISNQTWKNAQLKCNNESGALALPEDQSQYDLLVEYAKRMCESPELRFHVGFHRLLPDKNWTTVHGGPLTFEKFANRDTDEDSTDKQCGGMLVSNNNNHNIDGFFGESCSMQLPFMCEIIIPAECT